MFYSVLVARKLDWHINSLNTVQQENETNMPNTAKLKIQLEYNEHYSQSSTSENTDIMHM